MTVHKLIKELEKIEKKYGPRTRICIDLRELKSTIEHHDEYSHWEANCIDTQSILWYVEDNCELADGSQREKIVAVLC